MKNLVFLHGFPFHGSSWSKQAAFFGKKYNVLTPNLRGHLDGPTGPAPWFMHHFVADLKSLLDEKGIDRAILCGISMGGYLALHFAELYPARVEGLILCDTRPDADGNEAKDKRFASAEKIHKDGLPAFAEDFSRNVLTEAHRNSPLQKELGQLISRNKADSVALVLGTLASRRDASAFLPKITCPTIVVVGDQDAITPVAVNEAMAKKIPGAEYEVIANAGHMSNLEQPEAFNRVLGAFLDKNF